ncbi:hypothetical protein HPB48_009381 [Haemaphysalis longicornis]|uniref:Rad21/Rec8-like protein N-terminal domain-containing protein n=1 Tax=Haemaphysalis longicornis TaxID=44386 RepID=A0A9J6FEK3_HAELO|nr:hypothetical protein HPB48_009381 [Haemaphysalis longicornis]
MRILYNENGTVTVTPDATSSRILIGSVVLNFVLTILTALTAGVVWLLVVLAHSYLLESVELAATSPKKIKNSSLLSVSLSNLAEELARSLSQGRLLPRALYSERYSLRLSAKLITGLWVLYRKKAAALRAKAEECLRLLTTRKRPRDQSIDLSNGAAEGGKKGGRRKRKGSPVPPLADTEPPSAHFGKVLLKEETPEELIVARLPPVPADTLTADLESITLREEVPLRMDPLGLDDDAFQEEITMEPVEGDDVMEELERLVALHGISSRAREDTTSAATQQEEGQPPEGRPVSPIVPR